MFKGMRIIMPTFLIFCLLLALSPSLAFGAETEYPRGVATAKESVVQVTAWIDGSVSSSEWSCDARGPLGLASGFFANEDGDVFTAAHAVEMTEEELVDGAIMYFIGSIWFEEGWYARVDFASFYAYNYGWAWGLWLAGDLNINADEVDYIYRFGEAEPQKVEDIKFRKNPETGMDIAILETGLSDTPYIGLRKSVPPEGTPAYVIGYAGIDLLTEFWQAMDDIMKDPWERPGSFDELMREAEERMVECLQGEGPSIEMGLLGSTTKIYDMDARRFYGAAWSGFSGGPVVDESGNCLGLLPWGVEGGRGWFIPAEHLNDASLRAGIDTFPALEISSVTVEPSLIGVGQSFEVRAEVSNVGFGKGDYTAVLTLEDGTEASQDLTVGEGETQTLVLSAVKESSGFSAGTLEIGRTSADVVANPVALSNLVVRPELVAPGENIEVQAEVTNVSGQRSTCVIPLNIGGEVEATRTLTLESGATETVTFLVSRDKAGTYEVTIGDLSQWFTVQAKIPWTLIGLIAAGLLGLAGTVLGVLALARYWSWSWPWSRPRTRTRSRR